MGVELGEEQDRVDPYESVGLAFVDFDVRLTTAFSDRISRTVVVPEYTYRPAVVMVEMGFS